MRKASPNPYDDQQEALGQDSMSQNSQRNPLRSSSVYGKNQSNFESKPQKPHFFSEIKKQGLSLIERQVYKDDYVPSKSHLKYNHQTGQMMKKDTTTQSQSRPQIFENKQNITIIPSKNVTNPVPQSKRQQPEMFNSVRNMSAPNSYQVAISQYDMKLQAKQKDITNRQESSLLSQMSDAHLKQNIGSNSTRDVGKKLSEKRLPGNQNIQEEFKVDDYLRQSHQNSNNTQQVDHDLEDLQRNDVENMRERATYVFGQLQELGQKLTTLLQDKKQLPSISKRLDLLEESCQCFNTIISKKHETRVGEPIINIQDSLNNHGGQLQNAINSVNCNVDSVPQINESQSQQHGTNILDSHQKNQIQKASYLDSQTLNSQNMKMRDQTLTSEFIGSQLIQQSIHLAIEMIGKQKSQQKHIFNEHILPIQSSISEINSEILRIKQSIIDVTNSIDFNSDNKAEIQNFYINDGKHK
eukprot:403363361